MPTSAQKMRKSVKRKRERAGEYVGFRTPASLKNRLETAAREANRSLSTEVQVRCEASLRNESALIEALDLMLGRPGAAIVLTMIRAMRDAGAIAAITGRATEESATPGWLADPFAFAQARAAVIAVLDAFAPPGEPKPPKLVPAVVVDVDAGTSRAGRAEDARDYTSFGEGIAAGVMHALVRGDLQDSLGLWAGRVREMLGPALTKRAAASLREER